MQNARENPIAAAAAAAAVTGQNPPPNAQQGANAENLLDIDFDGAAPASLQKTPSAGVSGLEGLAGTPQRVASPAPPHALGAGVGGATAEKAKGNADDLADLFGSGAGVAGGANGLVTSPVTATTTTQQQQQQAAFGSMMSNDDLMNGFASLNMGSGPAKAPPPPGVQLHGSGQNGGQVQQQPQSQQAGGGGGGKSKDDLLDLF